MTWKQLFCRHDYSLTSAILAQKVWRPRRGWTRYYLVTETCTKCDRIRIDEYNYHPIIGV